MDKSKTAQLVTTQEAAQDLRVSISFLAKARMNGTGPAFIRLGRAIRYSQDALDAFKAAQTRSSTSDRPQGRRARQRAPKHKLNGQIDFLDDPSINIHRNTSEYIKYNKAYEHTSEYM